MKKFSSIQISSPPLKIEDYSIEISLLDFMELNLNETIAEELFDDITEIPPQSLRRCEKAQQRIIQSLCRMLTSHGVKIIDS